MNIKDFICLVKGHTQCVDERAKCIKDPNWPKKIHVPTDHCHHCRECGKDY